MNLAPIFKNKIVFAARRPIRIYGEGEGFAQLYFAGQRKDVTCKGGVWFTEFAPMEYGGPYELRCILNGEALVLQDIYVGEVFLLAGQSNIEFKMEESAAGEELYRDNPRLRLYSTRRMAEGEFFTPEDGWVEAEKETLSHWSAIGYLAGDRFSRKRGVAVGLITCYQGASVIESWLPEGTLDRIGIHIPIEEKYKDHTKEPYARWNGEGTLFRNTLGQIAPFAPSAVVWYQGESDASMAEALVYKRELKALIGIWRRVFGLKELPFAVIQLADYPPRGEAWKVIQKAQWQIQSALPKVKTVISADVCEDDQIHPPTKDALAERLAEVLNELL